MKQISNINYTSLTLPKWRFITPTLSTTLIKDIQPRNAHSTTVSKSWKCCACYVSPLQCFTLWGCTCITNGDTSSNTSCRFFTPMTCIAITFFTSKKKSTKQLHMYRKATQMLITNLLRNNSPSYYIWSKN
jgi:hypothetical protein